MQNERVVLPVHYHLPYLPTDVVWIRHMWFRTKHIAHITCFLSYLTKSHVYNLNSPLITPLPPFPAPRQFSWTPFTCCKGLLDFHFVVPKHASEHSSLFKGTVVAIVALFLVPLLCHMAVLFLVAWSLASLSFMPHVDSCLFYVSDGKSLPDRACNRRAMGNEQRGAWAPYMLTIVFGGVETILTCLLIRPHKQIAICGTGWW